jgi:ankyrin repeat protein
MGRFMQNGWKPLHYAAFHGHAFVVPSNATLVLNIGEAERA